MVTIRLTRRGGRNAPFYHVVVTDSRRRQGGPTLELVGFFNPVARGQDKKLELKLDRIDHWTKTGAQMSDRVKTLVGDYRKTHLKGEERMTFRAGYKYPVFETTFGNVGMLMGYDLAFPEAARALALEGAELLVVCGSYEKPHQDEWRTYCLARAYENAMFVAAANRVGDDVTYSFFGDSMIVGPRGQVYATMSGEVDPKTNEPAEGYAVARIDLAEVRQRREEFQTLQNREPDLYKPLVRKY